LGEELRFRSLLPLRLRRCFLRGDSDLLLERLL
jgi:hypothetical protein